MKTPITQLPLILNRQLSGLKWLQITSSICDPLQEVGRFFQSWKIHAKFHDVINADLYGKPLAVAKVCNYDIECSYRKVQKVNGFVEMTVAWCKLSCQLMVRQASNNGVWFWLCLSYASHFSQETHTWLRKISSLKRSIIIKLINLYLVHFHEFKSHWYLI